MLSGFLQEQRFRSIIPYLMGSILDLGCGLTNLTCFIHPRQRYIGVEGPPAYQAWLAQNRPGCHFYQRDLDQDLPTLDEQFDASSMTAVIEHLEQPGLILRQLPTVMKPGASLVTTEPSPLGDRIHRFGARLGMFSKEAVEEHHTIFSPPSIRSALSASGLELLEYQRFLLGGNQIFSARAAG